MTDVLKDRVETAITRAAVSAREAVVTLAASVEADPLAVALAGQSSDFAYWEQPDRQFAIGASGSAWTIESEADADRFHTVSTAVRDLRGRTTQIALESADRSPLLIGGFSFFADPEWGGFSPGRLVLPESMVVRRGDEVTAVVAALVDGSSDPPAVQADLLARLEGIRSIEGPSTPAGEANHDRAAGVDLRDSTYVKTVASAVAEIEATTLQKVVVARALEVGHAPNIAAFLQALRNRFESCATFAFGTDAGLFCGATPERLVKVDGVAVSTAAVAGTAPRGADATQDEVIADRLRHDPKEREEHGYVISEIRRRLSAGGCVLDPPAPTDVMRLPGIQHLVTPITGTAPVGTDVLDLAGALHPTPAVAGLPVDQALDWISNHEPLVRGWYAGPVGWCDLAGNGEFRVALRSALIDADRTRLFAGAGIVGASSPERELEETSLKLGALLPLLLGS